MIYVEQLVKKSTSVLDLSRIKISDHYIADVAESADALASGASPRKGVWVQVPSSAPNGANSNHPMQLYFFKKAVAVVFRFAKTR